MLYKLSARPSVRSMQVTGACMHTIYFVLVLVALELQTPVMQAPACFAAER
jgi:hypothetical protein